MIPEPRKKKYRDWDLLEALPMGWEVADWGSPVFGYDFCFNGKSAINGRKTALVKTIRKGVAELVYPGKTHFLDKKVLEENHEPFPAKTVNILARKKFEEHLLKEILFDLKVCEIEGWSKKEYISELKKMINSINFSTKSKNNQIATPNLFSNFI